MDDAIRKAESPHRGRQLHPDVPRSADGHQAGRQRHGRSRRAWKPPCRTWSSWRRSACVPSSSTAAARPSTAPWPRAGLQPRKIQGRRVTDDAALDIVVRVLTQEINDGLVEQIRLLGGQASPLFDRGLQCLFGERLTLARRDGRPIDLGHVGRVTRVERRADRSVLAPAASCR